MEVDFKPVNTSTHDPWPDFDCTSVTNDLPRIRLRDTINFCFVTSCLSVWCGPMTVDKLKTDHSTLQHYLVSYLQNPPRGLSSQNCLEVNFFLQHQIVQTVTHTLLKGPWSKLSGLCHKNKICSVNDQKPRWRAVVRRWDSTANTAVCWRIHHRDLNCPDSATSKVNFLSDPDTDMLVDFRASSLVQQSKQAETKASILEFWSVQGWFCGPCDKIGPCDKTWKPIRHRHSVRGRGSMHLRCRRIEGKQQLCRSTGGFPYRTDVQYQECEIHMPCLCPRHGQ